MERLFDLSGTELGPIAAVAFVLLGYLVITIDRSRSSSPSKDDHQVGLKLVLFGFVIAGVHLAAHGIAEFLGFALGGFKGGGAPARLAMPPIIVGSLIVFAVTKYLLPRTNTNSYRQCERFVLGAIGIELGVLAIVAVDSMLTSVFNDGSWSHTADALAIAAVDGAIALYAVNRFGALSGWTQPVAPPPPPQAPPGGGYPPQGFPPPYNPPPAGGNPYAPR